MTCKTLYTKVPIRCRECDWYSAAVDADRSCPACGGTVEVGTPTVKRPRRERPRTFGRVGEPSAEVEAYVDEQMRLAREAAYR